jgi:hypothetical protein
VSAFHVVGGRIEGVPAVVLNLPDGKCLVLTLQEALNVAESIVGWVSIANKPDAPTLLIEACH